MEVVGLGDEAAAPLVDEVTRQLDLRRLRRLSPRHVRDASLERSEYSEQVQIERNLVENLRPLYLDGDLSSVECGALVDLPDRRRGDRLLAQRRKTARELTDAQLTLEDGARLDRVKRGHRILKLAELEGVGLWDEVGADGESLRKLDERRTQLRRQTQRLRSPRLLVRPRDALG